MQLPSFLFLILLIISGSQIRAQEKPPFVPFYKTWNSKKLANRITRNCKDDSCKVYVIHYWITHHIKYDVKKFFALDHSQVEIRKVLRSRKAVCTGYTDLFNTLCKEVNISSVSVPGYIKNEFVDLQDSMYTDEHSWNAVYINKKWCFIDACWDAGYIKYPKRTFYGWLVYITSFGKSEVVRIKPHFKFAPTLSYFEKSSSELIADHFPANPLWQLENRQLGIEEFENDSSYYFGKDRIEPVNSYSKNEDLARLNFSQLSPKEQQKTQAQETYTFNTKNHIPIATDQFSRVKGIFQRFKKDKQRRNRSTYKRGLDSLLNSCQNHLDSSLYYLNLQHEQLVAKNDIKRSIYTSNHSKLIHSTNRSISSLKIGTSIFKTIRTDSKVQKRKNFKNLKLFQRSKRFAKARPLKTIISSDSIQCLERIRSLEDSAKKTAIVNFKIFSEFDSAGSVYHNVINRYSDHVVDNKFDLKSSIKLRMNFNDELDLLIQRNNALLIPFKLSKDSLLYLNGESIFRVYSNDFRKLKRSMRLIYSYRKGLQKQYIRMKKLGGEVEDQYTKNIEAYAEETEFYNDHLIKIRSLSKTLGKKCRLQLPKTRAEIILLAQESKNESQINTIRSRYIEKRFVRLSNGCKKMLRKCKDIKARSRS